MCVCGGVFVACRFVGVKVERDQLYEQFQKAIHSVKQKSSFKASTRVRIARVLDILCFYFS